MFAVVVLVWMQTMNPRAPERWTRPSMYSSSLRLAQPLQKFYIGALCMIAGGVSYMVFGIFKTEVRWFWEIPLPAGIGVWLGVQLCIWGFPDRFEPRANTAELR
jgi:hypothetical protein